MGKKIYIENKKEILFSIETIRYKEYREVMIVKK